jgi:metallo-beta-lactamase class B
MRFALVFAAALGLAQSSSFTSDPPKACDSCAEWNQPREPYKLFGNTYYVGVAGLSSVLITSDRGHILVDGALQQSAPLIDANIRRLGFKTADVKLIATSHAHYDHSGGLNALQRASGATVAASAWTARALRQGNTLEDDPQFGFGREANAFPAVSSVREVTDGETLTVGSLEITAHVMPGHTPGGTTWTWRSCEGARCVNIVYADSLTAVSAPGFRFSGGGGKPSIVDTFRRSIAAMAALPCDLLLAAHPFAADLDGKLARRAAGATPDPFIDSRACKALAAAAGKQLDERVAGER